MAQLVARFHGMEEARGSNPLSSTRSALIGGFISKVRAVFGSPDRPQRPATRSGPPKPMKPASWWTRRRWTTLLLVVTGTVFGVMALFSAFERSTLEERGVSTQATVLSHTRFKSSGSTTVQFLVADGTVTKELQKGVGIYVVGETITVRYDPSNLWLVADERALGDRTTEWVPAGFAIACGAGALLGWLRLIDWDRVERRSGRG